MSSHRRRRWWLWALALVTPTIGVAVWLAWFSPWLSVDEVRIVVTGEAPPSAGEFPLTDVEAVVELPEGTPLLRVPTAEIEARVSALPQVQSVSVVREWPRTLLIDVTRREPVAYVEGPTGFDLVDLQGMVVTVVASRPDDLPFVAATGAGIPAALAVAAELPEWLRTLTDVVEATTRNDVTLILGKGAEVLWGNAEQGELKAQVLESLLSDSWDRYDVSSPQVPTTSRSWDTDDSGVSVEGADEAAAVE
jgi:cell division protein FtsQ